MIKKRISTWKSTLLKQAKSYIDNNISPDKINVIDPTKENFTEPLSVQEILDALGFSKADYYRALSLSKDKDLELQLKIQPNSCCFNNYYVFNEYNTIISF